MTSGVTLQGWHVDVYKWAVPMYEERLMKLMAPDSAESPDLLCLHASTLAHQPEHQT